MRRLAAAAMTATAFLFCSAVSTGVHAALAPQSVVFADLGDNYVITVDAVKIFPNPPWEHLTTVVQVPVGSYILIDELHLATECVPEPATMMLRATGAAGGLTLRRRRRK